MPRQLDIGCSGFTRGEPGYEEVWGIDIVPHPDEPTIKQADLALEPIDFEDNYFDLVTAHDFLEHIPTILYISRQEDAFDSGFAGTKKWKATQRHCLVELFNEIYRVLKPMGEFYASSPCYPDKSAFQDPTHLSFWTEDTPYYFSGDYFSFHDHYGHTSRFELVEKHVTNGHIQFRLKARKDIQDGTPYQLSY